MKGPLGAPAKTGQVTGAVKSSIAICNLCGALRAYSWILNHVKRNVVQQFIVMNNSLFIDCIMGHLKFNNFIINKIPYFPQTEYVYPDISSHPTLFFPIFCLGVGIELNTIVLWFI